MRSYIDNPAPGQVPSAAEPSPPAAIVSSVQHSGVRGWLDKFLGRDDPERVGVRGWLLVICILFIIISPLTVALTCSLLLQNVTTTWFNIGHLTPFLIIALAIVVIYVAIAGYGVYAGYSLWTIKPKAVPRAKRFLISWLLFPLLSDVILIAGAQEYPALKTAASETMGDTLWALFYILIVILVIFRYFDRSRRVANTYR